MRPDDMRLMSECPTVVGMVTTSVESGGSLDTAARSVAESGPPGSRELFSRAVRRTDTKECTGVPEALAQEVGSLPEGLSGYRNAMLLCIAASESEGREERMRLLGEASDIALDSVGELGERYGASLNLPCMTVFGLGIMLPMILMSIVPMVGVGGMLGDSALDPSFMALVTLVLVPAVIAALCLWLRRGNPFATGDPETGFSSALPMLAAVPLAAAACLSGMDADATVLLSVAPAATLTALTMLGHRRSETSRRSAERSLRESVFEMGNRMMSGTGFEQASMESLSSREGGADTGTALERELMLCRGDVASAVGRAVGPVSSDLASSYIDIHRCAMGSIEDAGRLAIALGRQFHNSDAVMSELRIRLKGMTDMMTGTALLFAPLVLGMSVSMIGPLSEITGYDDGDTISLMSVYLVELCALIAMLTTSLEGSGGFRTVLWRFCTTVPICLVVFQVCCSVGFRARPLNVRSGFPGHGPQGVDGVRVRSDGCLRTAAVLRPLHGALQHVHRTGRDHGVHRQRLARARPGRTRLPVR